MHKLRVFVSVSMAAIVVLTATHSTFGEQKDLKALEQQRQAIAQQISAKNKELQQVRETITKSDKMAPAQKEVLAAYQAIQAKKEADPEVQKARQARDAANKSVEAAVAAELTSRKEGAEFQKQIEEAQARIKQSQQAIQAAERGLGELRRKVAGDSPKVAAARAAADKVAKNYEEIKAGKTAAERARHDKLRAAYDAKTDELLAGDARGAGLRKSLDDLQKKDRELADQMRAIEHSAKQPAKKIEAKPVAEKKPEKKSEPKAEKKPEKKLEEKSKPKPEEKSKPKPEEKSKPKPDSKSKDTDATKAKK